MKNTKIKAVKLIELKSILRKQRYPDKIIDSGIKKACDIPIDVLRSEKKRSKTQILPFVSTFNPNNTNVLPIIKNTIQNLQQSRTMKEVFKDYKFIKSWRQPPNLERILCKSKFTSKPVCFAVAKCGKSCFCCDYILEGSSFKFKKEKKLFNLKSNFNCESSNLIYVVICDTCGEEYIGQTGTLLKERVSVYKQHIAHPQYQQIKVEGHLRICGKSKFKIFPFFQVKENNKALREAYENHFIERFQPSLNAR